MLQDFLDAVSAGEATVPVGRVFTMDDIREAHSVLEAGTAGGKIVVVTKQTTPPQRGCGSATP